MRDFEAESELTSKRQHSRAMPGPNQVHEPLQAQPSNSDPQLESN
jgi:hypothetical protein